MQTQSLPDRHANIHGHINTCKISSDSLKPRITTHMLTDCDKATLVRLPILHWYAQNTAMMVPEQNVTAAVVIHEDITHSVVFSVNLLCSINAV